MEADDGYAGEEVSCPNCGLTFNVPNLVAPSSNSALPNSGKKGKKKKGKAQGKSWLDHLPMPEASRQFWKLYSARRFAICVIFLTELAFVLGFLFADRLSDAVRYTYRINVVLFILFFIAVRGRMHSFERDRPSSLPKVVGSALGALNLFLLIAILRGSVAFGGMQAPGLILRGATTPDAGQLLVAGTEGVFEARPFSLGWNTESGVAFKFPRLGKVTSLGMAQTGPTPLAIAGTEGGAVEVWDPRDGVATASFALPDTVGGVALLNQGQIAVGAGGQEFKIWDTRSREAIHEESSRRTVVTGMAPSPDGRRVAVVKQETMGGPGGGIVSLYIWEVLPNQRPTTVGSMNYAKTTVGRIRGMAFSPEGSRFLVGADGGYIYLYELKDRKLIEVSTGHYPDGIRAVAFSKTGKFLVAGTGAGGVLVFDKSLEEPIDTFSVGSDPVNVLSPTKNNGEFLYAVGRRIKRLNIN